MKRYSIRFLLSVLLLTLLSFPNCKEKHLCDPSPQFDIDLFVQEVDKRINDPENAVAGYQFVVNQNGNFYDALSGGFAIYDVDDGGPVPMTVDTRLNVASVSKFVGTIALMQVLEKHGINPWSYIYFSLPESWKNSMHEHHYKANFGTAVTFDKMLQMKTGIQFGMDPDNWDPGIMPTTTEMLRAISIIADEDRMDNYQNGNFTLIRVFIGELEYQLNTLANDYNYQTAEAYFDYIKREIFDKIGISPPMSIPAINNYFSDDKFARAHQWPFDSTFRDGNGDLGWAATSNPENNGGSGGLVLSAMDLARLLAYFKHTEVLCSKGARERILKEDLGLWGTKSGAEGKYSSKGGTRGPQNGTLRAIRSMIMMFPNGVEAVLLVNSNHDELGKLLREAFDASWINPCE